jgi:hypothetical protein
MVLVHLPGCSFYSWAPLSGGAAAEREERRMTERVVMWDKCSGGMVVFLVVLGVINIGLVFLFFTEWAPIAVVMVFFTGTLFFLAAPSRHIWTWNYDADRVRFENRAFVGFRTAHWEVPISSLVGAETTYHGDGLKSIRVTTKSGEFLRCEWGSDNYSDKERLVERFEEVIEAIKTGQAPGGALSVADAPTGSLSPAWENEPTSKD